MLLILNRYKIFFIILSIILLFLLIWLFVSGQENGKTPSRGVFVFLGSVFTEGRIIQLQQVMSSEEYRKYVERKSTNSKLLRNILRAYLVGGLICVLGQFFTNYFKQRGFDKDIVASLTSMVMVFLGVAFTGLNIYDDLGRFAGAGSIVPITGFANSIVSPAMEYKSEGYVLGIGARMFLIAGPVLVYGISTSIVAGIIYYLLRF